MAVRGSGRRRISPNSAISRSSRAYTRRGTWSGMPRSESADGSWGTRWTHTTRAAARTATNPVPAMRDRTNRTRRIRRTWLPGAGHYGGNPESSQICRGTPDGPTPPRRPAAPCRRPPRRASSRDGPALERLPGRIHGLRQVHGRTSARGRTRQGLLRLRPGCSRGGPGSTSRTSSTWRARRASAAGKPRCCGSWPGSAASCWRPAGAWSGTPTIAGRWPRTASSCTSTRPRSCCINARRATAAGRCFMPRTPGARIDELLAVREPLYREVADLVVATGRRGSRRVVQEILRALPGRRR